MFAAIFIWTSVALTIARMIVLSQSMSIEHFHRNIERLPFSTIRFMKEALFEHCLSVYFATLQNQSLSENKTFFVAFGVVMSMHLCEIAYYGVSTPFFSSFCVHLLLIGTIL